MIQEMGTDVGCALLQQTVGDNICQQILTCNYSYINIVDLPVYTVGSPGSQCVTGTDRVYRHLCSDYEQYEVTGIPHYVEK